MTSATSVTPTRYVPSSSDRYKEYISAAERYTFQLPDIARAGLLIKPLDAGNNHVNYLRSTYSLLNVIQKLHLPGGSTIVDAGAGPGWIAEHLLLLGYRVILLEPSQDMLDIARIRISRAAEKWGIDLLARAEFVTAGIEDLPPQMDGSGVAQAVLFHEAWHHVIREDVAAAKVFGLLAPGGQIAVLVEGRWYPGVRSLEDVLDQEMRTYGTLESPFTRDYMQTVLERAGFDQVEFYHSVNGLFSAAEGDVAVKDAAGEMHERGWNNCIAHRPSLLPLDAAATASRLTLTKFERLSGAAVRVSVVAENTGQTTWRSNKQRGDGLVTLGMREQDRYHMDQEMNGRASLAHDVEPGCSIEMSGDFAVVGTPVTCTIGLVAEGSFWLPEKLVVDWMP